MKKFLFLFALVSFVLGSNFALAQVQPVQYFGAADIKAGQTITAPSDQKVNIVIGDQKIDLKEGSVIKYVDQYTWQVVSGNFRFIEKVAVNGKYKVKVPGAVIAIRGTQFLIDAAANSVTITILKGMVIVTPIKGKATATVKAGYQLTITGSALGKPAQFNANTLDAWYESIPANTNFVNASWKKAVANTTWSRRCTVTSSQATPTETLTAEEQQTIDAFNQQAIPVFRVHELDALMGPNKVSTTKEKTTVNLGTKAVRMMTDSKSFYYSGDSAGAVWKVFKDKTMVSGLLQAAKTQNIVTGVDQSTLTFDHWNKVGNTRIAAYSAKGTQSGTEELINSALAPGAGAGQELATGTIYIDEDTQQWLRYDVNAYIKTGKIAFTLHKTCQYTYDAAVKIKLPAKAKSIAVKAGTAELQQIYNAAQ